MADVVRAAGLRGLPDLVTALGRDGDALLAAHGIPPTALNSDDAVIPSTAAARVLESAATACDCGDLGLRLAGQQNASVLGPLAIAIENSPTLGEALDCARRFLFVHSPGLTVAEVPDPEHRPGVSGIRYAGATSPLPPQVADLGLGLLHRVTDLLSGGYGLRSVHLPHPPLAPVARYTAFFGADVRFDQPAAVLRVPQTLAATPVAGGGNEMLREVALDYMRGHFPAPGSFTSARVRHLLARGLGSAPVHLAAVARQLRTHPRTLQRRLADEQVTFEELLDDVRRSAAHRLITSTDLPLSQVTAMVSLAEQSALTRACRRWFGVPPRELRRATRLSRDAGPA
ncbi:AraC family transcriptional regulator [Actinoplanes sp. NPDC049265]|uniref:AraC family transcriptional regulator n=1 Tax=Actinoplanes sp. NPDC049265 TaxID=3363902 RepID=UPI0037106F68